MSTIREKVELQLKLLNHTKTNLSNKFDNLFGTGGTFFYANNIINVVNILNISAI